MAAAAAFSCTVPRTAAATTLTKAAGDISSVFPSLSGKPVDPLPARFKDLKLSFVTGKEDVLRRSWMRLLDDLECQTREIAGKGSSIIPSINFQDVQNGTISKDQIASIKHRGCTVVRGVIPRSTALDYKTKAQQYIAANRQHVKAFPADDPAVYELYWSPSQVQARAHPNVLAAQSFLQSLWHSSDPSSEISTRYPLTYADRFRIRHPGDSKFALGPHVDGGSLERWEDAEYSSVYSRILDGNWEEYDPFDARHRIEARMDLYNGAGACAMFRMFQGWLSMSRTGPGEGTLRLFPLIRHSTAYTILRPFFDDVGVQLNDSIRRDAVFPNSVPGAAQEYSDSSHPHLRLSETMVSVPQVEPGDFVAWHCDQIHSVDKEHQGLSDSSVLYIPATPLCRMNVDYLKRQRDAALKLSPPPDFPGAGGIGEGRFVGAVDWEKDIDKGGMKAMGMGKDGWIAREDMSDGEQNAVEAGNGVCFGRR